MIKAVEHITSTLNHADIQASVPNGAFWELAEEKTQMPFITFAVKASGPITKGSDMREYEVKLRVFGSSLTAVSTASGVIVSALEATRWKDRGMTTGYTDPEAKGAWIEMTYEFKL